MYRTFILIILMLVFVVTGCSRGRDYISSEEDRVVEAEISVPLGKGRAEQEEKKEVTFEQKKELAKQVGIILPGMTKEEVKETLGKPRKTGFSASTGQEVWYYKSPKEQNIYFKDDKVERVEYLSKPIKPKPASRKPEEI